MMSRTDPAPVPPTDTADAAAGPALSPNPPSREPGGWHRAGRRVLAWLWRPAKQAPPEPHPGKPESAQPAPAPRPRRPRPARGTPNGRLVQVLVIACGVLLTLGAVGASAMSYSSNEYIAETIGGWDKLEAHIYPLVVDAPLLATAIGVIVMGLVGVIGWPVVELALMTLLAAALSLSGNALHGPIKLGLLAIPWPWNLWASLVVSAVPVFCICLTGEATRLLFAHSGAIGGAIDASLDRVRPAPEEAPAPSHSPGTFPNRESEPSSGVQPDSPGQQQGQQGHRRLTDDMVREALEGLTPASQGARVRAVMTRWPGVSESTAKRRVKELADRGLVALPGVNRA